MRLRDVRASAPEADRGDRPVIRPEEARNVGSRLMFLSEEIKHGRRTMSHDYFAELVELFTQAAKILCSDELFALLDVAIIDDRVGQALVDRERAKSEVADLTGEAPHGA